MISTLPLSLKRNPGHVPGFRAPLHILRRLNLGSFQYLTPHERVSPEMCRSFHLYRIPLFYLENIQIYSF